MPDDDTLSPSESTDSDEVRNDDGDTVVTPPDDWSEATKFGLTASEEEEGESLEYKLSAERPDVLDDVSTGERPAHQHHGQISGTPEDGDSLFGVEE